MDNKGFTLIEILVVIALLAIVIVITVPIIGNVSESVKKKTLNTKIDNIESAAVLYGQDNRGQFDDETCSLCSGVSNCYCFSKTITVDDLIINNKIKEDKIKDGNKVLVNPLDEDMYLNKCNIQLYQKYGKIYAVYNRNTPEGETNTQCGEN